MKSPNLVSRHQSSRAAEWAGGVVRGVIGGRFEAKIEVQTFVYYIRPYVVRGREEVTVLPGLFKSLGFCAHSQH